MVLFLSVFLVFGLVQLLSFLFEKLLNEVFYRNDVREKKSVKEEDVDKESENLGKKGCVEDNDEYEDELVFDAAFPLSDVLDDENRSRVESITDEVIKKNLPVETEKNIEIVRQEIEALKRVRATKSQQKLKQPQSLFHDNADKYLNDDAAQMQPNILFEQVQLPILVQSGRSDLKASLKSNVLEKQCPKSVENKHVASYKKNCKTCLVSWMVGKVILDDPAFKKNIL